ncbi:MAG: exodeoxyribonuclease VII small subunit [Cyclonatronaceae bacterium]
MAASSSQNPHADLSFEEALGELESIVRKLEDSSLPLEESVAQFEQGLKLSRHCSKVLEEAELRVKKVEEQESSGGESSSAAF